MLRGNGMQLNQGEKIGKIRRGLGISGQSYYRWRSLYGGLKVNQAERLKDLVRENVPTAAPTSHASISPA